MEKDEIDEDYEDFLEMINKDAKDKDETIEEDDNLLYFIYKKFIEEK